MKHYFTFLQPKQTAFIPLFLGLLLFIVSLSANAQLGVYTFTGPGDCPHPNPTVSSQPLNATFSSFTNVNGECAGNDNVFEYKEWSEGSLFDFMNYN